MTKPTLTNAQKRERVRKRVKLHVNADKYEFFPETVPPDYYDDDVFQLVAIYVRVSTGDPRQTTSYELQKQYYEEFVRKHPHWKLVDVYADEGISGTSLKHRDNFNRMIADCRAGKITMIITKSVSRFARNVVDFLGMIRMLREHTPSIGVFFESENIFSLNETNSMSLSFQATMAEEESRNKSRSMEASLRMRLDHGLPLTPKLLGYTHDEEGHLMPDPLTMHIPKLMFYMYLYGYTTVQIAEALTYLGKQTYKGNTHWTSSGITRSLRNERYCGCVFTRKTFTLDVISHKTMKNRGERPRSHYYDWHEGIVTRDDFIAVQHKLDNAKYRNESILPELRVVTEGLLKGFVVINPRWGAFKEQEYMAASASAYLMDDDMPHENTQYEVNSGDFDLRGFEICHLDFSDISRTPFVSLGENKIKFSQECVNRMPTEGYVELLVHPTERRLAVRRTTKDNRNAVIWTTTTSVCNRAKEISCAAFYDTLYRLFGWQTSNKYRMYGTTYKNGSESVYIFNACDAGVFLSANTYKNINGGQSNKPTITPIIKSGNRIGAIPKSMAYSFGKDFYQQQSLTDVNSQTREQWQLGLEGQLYYAGHQLKVTDFEELKSYIYSYLGDWKPQEDNHDEQQ